MFLRKHPFNVSFSSLFCRQCEQMSTFPFMFPESVQLTDRGFALFGYESVHEHLCVMNSDNPPGDIAFLHIFSLCIFLVQSLTHYLMEHKEYTCIFY